MVTTVGAGGLRVCGSIPDSCMKFSLPQSTQTGLWIHSISYSKVTKVLFQPAKRAGREANHPNSIYYPG